MKKKTVVLAAVILILAAAVLFLMTRKANPETDGQNPEAIAQTEAALPAEPSDIPADTQKEAVTEETQKPTEYASREQPFLIQITEDDPAIAYVLVRMPNPIGLLPLPQEGEYSKTIRQILPDGTEYVNILHLTPNGFIMEEANCEGHDCVKQGEVTLENREERVLMNMIICLPHQLSAELITREEAEAMLQQ